MPPRSHIKVPEPSVHSILLNIARRAHIFLSPDGQPHATIPLSGNTVPIYNQLFRDWLSLAFEERGFLPSSAQYGAVLRKLDEDARTCPQPLPVHIRAALGTNRTYHLDLDNSANEAIEINGKQWTTTYNDTCRFHRTEDAIPLPAPEPNTGPIHAFLMRLFSITEPNAQMLATWLVSAMLPDLKPPILVITGTQADEAAGKLRSIIDPVKCATSLLPVTENQFGQLGLLNRIPVFSIGPALTEKAKCSLNKLRTGISVKLKQVNKSRPAIKVMIHRPIIISSPAPIAIHESQLNIEINETCNTLPEQILASLLDAAVKGIREMAKQPEKETFAFPSLLPSLPPPAEPPPPDT